MVNTMRKHEEWAHAGVASFKFRLIIVCDPQRIYPHVRSQVGTYSRRHRDTYLASMNSIVIILASVQRRFKFKFALARYSL